MNTSGSSNNNFLSKGFVFSLVLIFPPPFHQQKRKKSALLGTGDVVVVTFTLLLDVSFVFTKHGADSALNSQALLLLTIPSWVTAPPFSKNGLEAEAG